MADDARARDGGGWTDALVHIPQALRDTAQWVSWRRTPPPKPGAKFGKIPINPATGANASSTDPASWGTFDAAVARAIADDLAGVGFVFTEASRYVGIDLDGCIDPSTGEIAAWALEIVHAYCGYVEVSPSGTGLHVIVQGSLPSGGRKKGPIEMYSTARYFTMTGDVLEEFSKPITDQTPELAALHAKVFAEPPPSQELFDEDAPADESPNEDLSDDEIIERARGAKNGAKFEQLWRGDITAYRSESEADLALCGLLAFWCRGDAARIDRLFRRSGLMRAKWDTKRGSITWGQQTINKALAGKTKFYKPRHAVTVKPGEPIKCTDTGNAERFVLAAGGDMRFCHPWKKWSTWTGTHWQLDCRGRAMSLGKCVARGIYKEAAKVKDADVAKAIAEWAHTSEKVERRKAMIELAKSESGIPVLPEEFDQDPWLLNCANGTLDLRTLQLRPHRREDCITKLTRVAYDPNARCPTWLAFLDRILPDREVRDFVQQVFGWAIVGEQRDQFVIFFVGEGANGKSTLLTAIQNTIGGDYAIQAAPEVLLTRRDRGHPTELADLFGVRIAVCTEVGEGRSLDEATVKRLTGGDRIKARRMKEDFWEFEATHHLFVAANHRPIIHGTDHAIWRRIIVVPFDVKIPPAQQNLKLPQLLKAEREGILAWIVEGCRLWRASGRLHPPEQVLLAVEDYREEMDVLGQFIAERCTTSEHAKVGSTQIYKAFQLWLQVHGEAPIAHRDFTRRMQDRGFRLAKRGTKVLHGIALLAWDGPPTQRGPSGTICQLLPSTRARREEPTEGPRSSPPDEAGLGDGDSPQRSEGDLRWDDGGGQ